MAGPSPNVASVHFPSDRRDNLHEKPQSQLPETHGKPRAFQGIHRNLSSSSELPCLEPLSLGGV